MTTQNSVARRKNFVRNRLDKYLYHDDRFSHDIFGNSTCLLSLRLCHFSNIFRVKNLDLMCGLDLGFV